MSASVVVRHIFCILAILITAVSVGLLASAILSSGWQVVTDPGSGEIYQHGLWLSYNRVTNQMTDPQNSNGSDWKWVSKYKFGPDAKRDEINQAEPYQVLTLFLLVLAATVGLFGILQSITVGLVNCCNIPSALLMFLSFTWVFVLALAGSLAAAGIILFNMAAMEPQNRYVYTDRKLEQVMGYSFWRGVGGTIGFGVALILSIGCTILSACKRKAWN